MVVAITACTGDPAPVGTVPNGSPTSSSASPTIAEPVRPIDKATPESAIQFTRYFWDLYNYAYQTYDTAPLKAISDPGCTYCSSTTKTVETLEQQETAVQGYQVSITTAASPPVKITSGTIVEVVLNQTPGRSVSKSGKATPLSGVKRLRATIGVAWNDGNWSIQGIDVRKGSGTTWPG